MLFSRIEAPGLAQYSYIVGDETEAVVIDPRRDVEVYLREALDAGVQITHILETHRHEDFVLGSLDLALRTGAQIWHADAQLPYKYGKPAEPGQRWQVGALVIEALHTPGHTEGSISYVLYEPSGVPWMVFCGDVLFAGEVGRVDFLGMDRAPEMALQLHDSIFNKLLPLGDGVLLCPAHGSGSACGSTIADRPWSTLGLERQLNPRLQFAVRESFVKDVVRKLPKPPYFERMEIWNLEGAPSLDCLPVPKALSAMAFMALVEADEASVIIDTRSMVSFAGVHIPGSLHLSLDMLSSYAGWFVSYGAPLLLVLEEGRDPMAVVRLLIRIGYNDIAGYLSGGILAWASARVPLETTALVSTQTLSEALGATWVLDVRDPDEVAKGKIAGAHTIFIKELADRLDEIPQDERIVVYCGGGPRAALAASVLQRAGCENAGVLVGGLRAWLDDGFPLD